MSNKEMEMDAIKQEASVAKGETAAENTTKEALTGYKKIEKGVVDGYKKIEEGVVTGYKKIQDGVVEGFGKVVDKCVEAMFAKDGETVEEAKDRLAGKDKE